MNVTDVREQFYIRGESATTSPKTSETPNQIPQHYIGVSSGVYLGNQYNEAQPKTGTVGLSNIAWDPALGDWREIFTKNRSLPQGLNPAQYFNTFNGASSDTSDYFKRDGPGYVSRHKEFHSPFGFAHQHSTASPLASKMPSSTASNKNAAPYGFQKCDHPECTVFVRYEGAWPPVSSYCDQHLHRDMRDKASSPAISNTRRYDSHLGFEDPNVNLKKDYSRCSSSAGGAWGAHASCRSVWSPVARVKRVHIPDDKSATNISPQHGFRNTDAWSQRGETAPYATVNHPEEHVDRLDDAERKGLNDYISALQQQIHHQQITLESQTQYQRMAPPGMDDYREPVQARYGFQDTPGHAANMSTDVAFLRRCLVAGALTPNDRDKALAIVNMIEGGTHASKPPDRAVTAMSQPAISRSPTAISLIDIKGNSALASFDMKLHDLSKTITKMHAQGKMQRMQQDSDRLARIESKLTDPKRDVVTSFQKRTAREVVKLNERLDALMKRAVEGEDLNLKIEDLQNELSDVKLRCSENGMDGTRFSARANGGVIPGGSSAIPTGCDWNTRLRYTDSIVRGNDNDRLVGTDGWVRGSHHNGNGGWGGSGCGSPGTVRDPGSSTPTPSNINGGWGKDRNESLLAGWGASSPGLTPSTDNSSWGSGTAHSPRNGCAIPASSYDGRGARKTGLGGTILSPCSRHGWEGIRIDNSCKKCSQAGDEESGLSSSGGWSPSWASNQGW